MAWYEPEETVGALWHKMVGAPPGPPHFANASVTLADLKNRLSVFFRGLGGHGAIEIKAAGAVPTDYRLSFRERLGHSSAHHNGLRFDGKNLFLPDQMDAYPEAQLNTMLYFWLAAFAVCAKNHFIQYPADPLQADLVRLHQAQKTSHEVLQHFPGLKARYLRLCEALRASRPARNLPPVETEIERTIFAMLGGLRSGFIELVEADTPDISHIQAPPDYRSFMPVILWGEPNVRPSGNTKKPASQTASNSNESEDGGDKTYVAQRRNADQAKQKDALLFNRFEAVLSIAEMLNLRRTIDDESSDNAKKAADDLDELSLVESDKAPTTRIKFDLDLAPQDVDRERLSKGILYKEWDWREGRYMPDYCRVLHAQASTETQADGWKPDKAASRRIRAVARRFEALRPKRQILHRQLDGEELDMDALVRSYCDLTAMGEGSDNVFLQTRELERDLSVAVLFDASRSTESWVKGRQVIDVAKEALFALTMGLSASNDSHAIYSFSSLKRNRVFIETIKAFSEKSGHDVLARISALRPGHYTRLGAAVRHVSALLGGEASERKLLLVITDGKPNDLDHYEGRYGVEDTRRAIIEARAAGQAVFGITVDSKARSYFPYMFGQRAFSILHHPDKLVQALPLIFQHLVAR
jgi:nitric oxide reductase NorD protein